jgi:hypothetical protein
MIRRGFPDDLPVRPAHALELDWWVTQRNFIRIWLPEGVFSDAGKIEWFLLREPTDLRWDCPRPGTWENRFEKPGCCEVVTRTTEREDGIDFVVRLKNLSARIWPGANMPVCVQLATAPDFRDPGLERTHYHTRTGWKRFDAESVRPAYPGGCLFFGGMRLDDAGDFDQAEIRVASRCGQWFLAHWFENAITVGGNCHESICCIHANPVVGQLKPGEMKESRGWLRLRKGAMDSPPLA